MTPLERRSVGLLAVIYALRMAGLFLIFPVFALYAQGLTGQTPLLIGLALGAYGLTQALLQIQFGTASDRYGRKPVIVVGLIIFAVGSVVAALSTSVWGVILGRALQGAGAIPAAVMALASDLTREEQRTKAMAGIGIAIGSSMLFSIVLGPVLNGWIGVPGIFWLTGILALLAIAVLVLWVPNPTRGARGHESATRAQYATLLRDPQLARLNIGIFCLHMAVPAMFLVIPHLVVEHLGLVANEHWKVYLPVMIAGVVTMVPFLAMGNRPDRLRGVLALGIAVLLIAECMLALGHGSSLWLIAGLWIFFSGFNILEAMLPSLISRLAPARVKGAAMGIYSTAQFLGAGIGGVAGGFLYGHFGATGVFVFAAIGFALWLAAVATMPPVKFLATRTVRIGKCSAAEAKRLAHDLLAVVGVAEAVVLADEGVVYLKVDATVLDESTLRRALPAS